MFTKNLVRFVQFFSSEKDLCKYQKPRAPCGFPAIGSTRRERLHRPPDGSLRRVGWNPRQQRTNGVHEVLRIVNGNPKKTIQQCEKIGETLGDMLLVFFF